MSYTIIDMTNHPRKTHFDYFRSLSYPYTGVTVEVNVTNLVEYCRTTGASFYLLMIHAAALAADAVPELRRRIHKGQVLEYDECPTSHIELTADSSYTYCTLHHHMEPGAYLKAAEQIREAARMQKGIQEEEDVESMYFISSLPWLHYTALIQPVAGGDESNPRITWGRYEKNADGCIMLPVSLLAHHALVDGIHLAAFFDHLQEQIACLTAGEA